MDKETFATSSMWKMTEALISKGITLAISALLARLVLPESHGIITLTAVFINFSIMLCQSGLGAALVRKENIEDVDYNNAFFMSLAIAAACYTVFFFAAPYIADFYNEPILTSVLRVQMLGLFLVSIGIVNGAIITRSFRFKDACIAGIISNAAGGLCGVIMAYAHWGVWALVFYTLLRDGIGSFVTFLMVRWHPTLKIDFRKMKGILSFSIWLLVGGIFDFIGNNFSGTLIGKVYSMVDLGMYGKGMHIPEMIGLYTFGSISGVMLPTFANYQNDNEKLKSVMRRMVEMSMYILGPMMLGLALLADKIIPFLFGPGWEPAVPIMMLTCIYFTMNPLRITNAQLLYAVGDSRAVFILDTTRSAMIVIGDILCANVFKLGINYLAAVIPVVSVINAVMTQFMVRKYIGYKYSEWFMDMLPALLLCAGMGVVVLAVGMIPLGNRYVLMFIQVIAGVAAYIGLSALTKNRSYGDILEILKNKLSRRRNG
ncbi:MAG: lipopolysaccharide biosynthesis protein [Firmicutes bacterium]|nr:lipopolysaccharide biosynthesis protein [Bacillota bacterium]